MYIRSKRSARSVSLSARWAAEYGRRTVLYVGQCSVNGDVRHIWPWTRAHSLGVVIIRAYAYSLGLVSISAPLVLYAFLLLMWFFTSPRNPYRETIEAKRTRRADALKHAPTFSTEKHQEFLDVTGNGFFMKLILAAD